MHRAAAALLVLLLALSPVARAPCPAVAGQPQPSDMCRRYDITVRNNLDWELELRDADCADGYLAAVEEDGSSVALPGPGATFIGPRSEGRLRAWVNRTVADCVLGAAGLRPAAGSFILHHKAGGPEEFFTFFYSTDDPVHPHWTFGGHGGQLGTGGLWGVNVSMVASNTAKRARDASSSTYAVAGCGEPPVPTHGTAPTRPATAEKIGGLQCRTEPDCATSFGQCCTAWAKFQCNGPTWRLHPEPCPAGKNAGPECASPSICQADGTWSSNGQVCTSDCGVDPSDEHAVVTESSEDDGPEIFQCLRGFELEGSELHSCPPEPETCAHPQPAYTRQCNRGERKWTIDTLNRTAGDPSKCAPEKGCCVSSCGDPPTINFGNHYLLPDLARTRYNYTCDDGFTMTVGQRGAMITKCEYDKHSKGWLWRPQESPKCGCTEPELKLQDGATGQIVNRNQIDVICGSSTENTFRCSRQIKRTGEQNYCCTGGKFYGEFGEDISSPTASCAHSLDKWRTPLLIAGGCVALLACVLCWCVRCTRTQGGGTDNRESLLGTRDRDIGKPADMPSVTHRYTINIDPRMSFGSQMLQRIERAGAERSRRDQEAIASDAGGSRSWTPPATEEPVDGGSERSVLPDRAVDMIPYSELQLLGKVGTGASGAVFQGAWRGTSCAVKRLNLILDKGTSTQFMAEVTMLTRVKHPRVVLFFGVSFHDHDCYLVTEYVARGNLQQMLASDEPLNRPVKLQMCHDVAVGMDFLHQTNIIHRDLKSANVLVSDGFRLKICDFGISRQVGMDAPTAMTGNIGTVPWTAPEVLSGEDSYDSKVDVFSYGILLWEIVTRRMPYAGINSIKIINAVGKGLRPQVPVPSDGDTYIAGLDTLMEQCWSAASAQRPDFGTVSSRVGAILAAETAGSE